MRRKQRMWGPTTLGALGSILEEIRRLVLGRPKGDKGGSNSEIAKELFAIRKAGFPSVASTWLSSDEFFVRWHQGEIASSLSEFNSEPTKLRLTHVHVPKTGGTSLNTAIQKAFSPSEQLVQVDSGTLWNYPMTVLVAVPFLAGHEAAAILPHRLEHSNHFSWTVLRDPMDHVLSQYSHLERMGRLPKGMAFEKFLETSRYQNLQSRALARRTVLRRKEVPWRDDPKRFLEMAIETLERVDHVGFFPNLNYTYKAIASVINADLPVEVPRENVAPHRPAMTKKARALIEEFWSLDLELWAYANAHF